MPPIQKGRVALTAKMMPATAVLKMIDKLIDDW